MKIRSVFFDRDGTLTYYNKEKKDWLGRTVSGWSGKPLDLPYEKSMALMELAGAGKKKWYTCLEDEKDFFFRYYRYMLIGEGVQDDLDRRAELLLGELWCSGDRLLYPETEEVLEELTRRGYSLGVISDTSPSLEYTLQQLGIAKYFRSFTCSALVGAMKPDPVIFNAALSAHGVTAGECVYVDDYKPEADGARELGFTSFLIDRKGSEKGEWVIDSLRKIVEWIDENGEADEGRPADRGQPKEKLGKE